MVGVSYAQHMTNHTITITFQTDDVASGLVARVARAAAFALHPNGGSNSMSDVDGNVSLTTGIEALNINEARRTARVMVGAITPMVASVCGWSVR